MFWNFVSANIQPEKNSLNNCSQLANQRDLDLVNWLIKESQIDFFFAEIAKKLTTFDRVLNTPLNQACRSQWVKTEISPNFLGWKFCGKAQFPHSLRLFARNSAETASFHKIFTPGN